MIRAYKHWIDSWLLLTAYWLWVFRFKHLYFNRKYPTSVSFSSWYPFCGHNYHVLAFSCRSWVPEFLLWCIMWSYGQLTYQLPPLGDCHARHAKLLLYVMDNDLRNVHREMTYAVRDYFIIRSIYKQNSI